MIVDCHTHIWDAAGRLGDAGAVDADAAWLTDAGPQAHLQAAAGVDRCFVLGFVSHHLNAAVPNELIAEYVTEHPEKMLGFAGADPTDPDATEKLADDLIHVPESSTYLNPILMTVPLQLLAYHIAVIKGTDVDQPRNLAKSVTVE